MKHIKSLFLLKLLLLLLCSSKGYAQAVISGIVNSEDGSPLADISVFLRDSVQDVTLAHRITDTRGLFSFETPSHNGLYLIFSNILYERQKQPVHLDHNRSNKGLQITMKESVHQIKEVVITAQRSPILIKNDTVIYSVRHYTDGTEVVIEELLAKLPGIEVDVDGTIRVGNKQIEKIMVEGDDLFEKGYKVLSKNIPAYPIKEVEVINNYLNNSLLKGIYESEKVALNLKLTDDAKNIWFGNVRGSIGTKRFYQLVNNLMNFGKRQKTYLLANINNVGSAIGELNHLFELKASADLFDVVDHSQSVDIISFSSPFNLFIDDKHSKFIDSRLVSFNNMLNLSPKNKLRLACLYNYEGSRIQKNTLEQLAFNGVEQINTQENSTKMREQVAFCRVDFTHEPTKDNRIESNTMFYDSRNKGLTDLIFNKEASQEQYKMRQMRLEQRLDYTLKVKASGLLAFSGYYIHEKKPQFYDIDRFYFERLFPQYQDIAVMNQSADSRMDLLQGNVSYLTRMGSHLLFLQLGDNYRNDQLKTGLFLLDSTTNRYDPLDYKNDLKYRTNDLYFLTNYEFHRNSLKLSGALLIHYYSALFESKKSKGMNALRIDPKLRFIWKINKRNKISATYAFESNLANISELYTNAILSGFRSFKRGYDKPEVLRRSNFALNYNYGGYGDDFTANLLGFYIKNHDAFSSYLTFKDSTFESRSILVHGNSIGNVTLQFDYYIKPLKSNTKLSLGASYSSFERAVNEEETSLIKSNSSHIGVEIRTAFLSFFNFHLGSKWSMSKSLSNISRAYGTNIFFFDLYFNILKNLTFKAGIERNTFSKEISDRSYYFAHFNLNYEAIPNTLKLGLTGSNLFNNQQFVSVFMDELSTSITEYKLRPRSISLTFEYRY